MHACSPSRERGDLLPGDATTAGSNVGPLGRGRWYRCSPAGAGRVDGAAVDGGVGGWPRAAAVEQLQGGREGGRQAGREIERDGARKSVRGRGSGREGGGKERESGWARSNNNCSHRRGGQRRGTGGAGRLGFTTGLDEMI